MNHFQGSSGRVVLFFPSWSGAVPDVILPIVITLIVITLSVFSLVALYKMCQKKTPERQENGAEQAQSDKEGVKLLSVKTTSSETGQLHIVERDVCVQRAVYPICLELERADLWQSMDY
ncbi:endomucin-like isoform X2 [Aphelocoma coerulescens]|uniref:endomucin-like isoform X2 n=1 Tax=Aphelocoma coerulescens TaxID=39617 RepID=UPI003604A587